MVWDDQKWIKYLENTKVKTFVLQEGEDLIGFCEQIFHTEKKSCEIAYFGILKEYYGKKYGGYLLSKSIENSFSNFATVFSSKVLSPSFTIDLSSPNLLDLPPARITGKIMLSFIKTNIKHSMFI